MSRQRIYSPTHASLTRFQVFVALSLVSLLFAIPMLAAGPSNSNDKADENLKSNARVNPSTLAMELSVPIASYPGRSGNSVPLVLHYSSKVWGLERYNSGRFEESFGPPTQPGTPFQVTTAEDYLAKFGERSISGWTNSLSAPAILTEFESYNQMGDNFPT